MKSNFFFANSAVSSIFLTPVSELIRLREDLINKLQLVDVICILSSCDPETNCELYEHILITRDLISFIEEEIERRYLERTGCCSEEYDYDHFREIMDDILYEESILRYVDRVPLEVALQAPPLGVCFYVKATIGKDTAYAEPKRENLKKSKVCTTLKSSRPRKQKSSARKPKSKV